jgi:hypothetical protein
MPQRIILLIAAKILGACSGVDPGDHDGGSGGSGGGGTASVGGGTASVGGGTASVGVGGGTASVGGGTASVGGGTASVGGGTAGVGGGAASVGGGTASVGGGSGSVGGGSASAGGGSGSVGGGTVGTGLTPTFLVGHAESTGQCNVNGVEGACDGTNSTPWKNPFPQSGVCAVGAKMTTGQYAGSALKMCATFPTLSFYQVKYDAQNNPTSVVPISSIDTGNWVTQTLGGIATQPPGSGVETDIVFDPFIGSNGAFVVGLLGWMSTTHPAHASPIVAVSQTPDPTGAWNSVVLYDQTPDDVNGDITIHVGYDSNGLYVSALHQPATLTSVIWAWGQTSNGTTPLLANLNSSTYGGTAQMPYPPVHYGSASSMVPGYVLWPTIDNTKAKPQSAPYVTITDCDVFANCQNSTRMITLTAYELTWTNSFQASLTKIAIPTSIKFNSGGAACTVQNLPNHSGPPDYVFPNGIHAENGNNSRNFFAAESPSHHIYLQHPAGCVAANKTNGFYTIDVDFSAPASPVINTSLSGYNTPIGVQPMGGLDATYPTAVIDSSGDVIWTFASSGLNQFLGFGAVVKPAGSNTLTAPAPLDSVMTSGTISTAGSTCTATSCAQTTFKTGPSQVGIIISGSFTGTLNFESPSGAPLSCNLAGASPLVAATSTTAAQAWGCPTAGLSGIRVRASSLTSGTPKVIFQENYGSARASATCKSTAYPDVAGINGSAQLDPNNPSTVWVDGSAGTTNIACSWQTRGVSFTLK